MQRIDAKWRNGGRWLSLALLGGLALNATAADTASHSSLVHSWITLDQGSLCRTWSAPLSATRELSESIPSQVATPAAGSTPLASATTSQPSVRVEGTGSGLKSRTVKTENSIIVTHCTTQWHISPDNRVISDTPSWTPNPTGDWPVVSDMTLLTGRSLTKTNAKGANQVSLTTLMQPVHKTVKKWTPPPAAPAAPTAPSYTSVGGIGPWTPVPGHPSYGMSDFAGDPYSAEYGSCTWWAWYTRRDEPQLGTLGMAYSWMANARARGMSVGYSPAVGATVVFQPGVQGAGSGGHVGHVVQLLSGGWFIISEMNFYWNGGGWGRVDYRYVHVGSGVGFIY